MTDKDTLFTGGDDGAGSFVFDEKVVSVFPDMISRSVPGYGLIVPMIGLLARRYASDGSNIYDLGCSLGAVTLAMRSAVQATNVRFIAVDNSAAMVRRCREIMAGEGDGAPVDVIRDDIRNVRIGNASVVALNFTLQFVEPSHRLELLQAIAKGLRPGGVLIFSEKIRFEGPPEQTLQATWHHDYKRARGYSELEIAGKRTALENVLQADTEAEHRDRLEQAGFQRLTRWFQCFNFTSYIAFR